MSNPQSQISDEEKELLAILNEPNTCNINSISGGTNTTISQIDLSNAPMSVIVEIAEQMSPEERKKIMYLNKHFISLFTQKQISNTKRECIKRSVDKSFKTVMSNIGDFFIVFYFDTKERPNEYAEKRRNQDNFVVEKKPRGRVYTEQELNEYLENLENNPQPQQEPPKNPSHTIQFHFEKGYFSISIIDNIEIAQYLKNNYWLNDEAQFENPYIDTDGFPHWSIGGWLEPNTFIAYEKFLPSSGNERVVDKTSKSLNVLDIMLYLIHTYKLQLTGVPDIHLKSETLGLGYCKNLLITHPDLWKKCIEGTKRVGKLFKRLEWYRLLKDDEIQGGTPAKKKYKNRWYKIRTGVNGGKYIVISAKNKNNENIKKKIYV
jgi:hypothetical protein